MDGKANECTCCTRQYDDVIMARTKGRRGNIVAAVVIVLGYLIPVRRGEITVD